MGVCECSRSQEGMVMAMKHIIAREKRWAQGIVASDEESACFGVSFNKNM